MPETIETALVYIHRHTQANEFVGCGALIEGGYIATCRHVWRTATVGHDTNAAQTPRVQVVFPRSRENGQVTTCSATLVDVSEGDEEGARDLALLRPETTPAGILTLQLAAHERFEVGAGYAYARLVRTDETNTPKWHDVFLHGQIDSNLTADGLRQFTGRNMHEYWFTAGSSGSPVFVEGGQQLAGIISLSELGANEGASRLHEAFIIPATSIRPFVIRGKEHIQTAASITGGPAQNKVTLSMPSIYAVNEVNLDIAMDQFKRDWPETHIVWPATSEKILKLIQGTVEKFDDISKADGSEYFIANAPAAIANTIRMRSVIENRLPRLIRRLKIFSDADVKTVIRSYLLLANSECHLTLALLSTWEGLGTLKQQLPEPFKPSFLIKTEKRICSALGEGSDLVHGRLLSIGDFKIEHPSGGYVYIYCPKSVIDSSYQEVRGSLTICKWLVPQVELEIEEPRLPDTYSGAWKFGVVKAPDGREL
ncbi:MAG TPA: trypsin-like peptidase domain-containing protein [Stellaceae bacterium]|jgi:hypothetical protein|nr:trypsin-like peptidase domain-containing protein [Stellaceae bacterium]